MVLLEGKMSFCVFLSLLKAHLGIEPDAAVEPLYGGIGVASHVELDLLRGSGSHIALRQAQARDLSLIPRGGCDHVSYS